MNPTTNTEAGAVADVAAIAIPPFVDGQLVERAAVGRFIAFQAARAGYRLSMLSWWDVFTARKLRWTLAALTGMLKDIEEGKHQDRQASWMIDIEGGEWLDRSLVQHLTSQGATAGVVGGKERGDG